MKNKKRHYYFYTLHKNVNKDSQYLKYILCYFFLAFTSIARMRYRLLEAVVRWRLALYASLWTSWRLASEPGRHIARKSYNLRATMRFHLIEARAAKPLIDILSIARYEAHTQSSFLSRILRFTDTPNCNILLQIFSTRKKYLYNYFLTLAIMIEEST